LILTAFDTAGSETDAHADGRLRCNRAGCGGHGQCRPLSSLERFTVAHDRGSSHGQTRIIRKAYFEHPSYVPLLHRAYELWAELERISGRELFRRTGLLLSGPVEGPIVSGVQRSAREHRLQIERLSVAEARQRFDGFCFPDSNVVLFEPDAGFLHVEDCVRTHVEAALKAGAQLRVDAPVISWSVQDGRVIVRLPDAEVRAPALVITGGPWAGRLLADLKLPLEVRRKVVFWYEPLDTVYDVQRGCPVYGFDTTDGFMYGFPVIDASGAKVAQHSGGCAVSDPADLDRSLRAADEAPVSTFIRRHLPRLRPGIRRYSVCMYTMTPDEHFIIDRHPEHENVVFAAGFSGHGFKFAPVVGSVLADLVAEGRTAEPIEFLSAGREMLRGSP
jgi:sarcosine oxidase